MRVLKLFGLLLLFFAITMSCRDTYEEDPFIPIERMERHSLNTVDGLAEALAPYVNLALDQSGPIPSANLDFKYRGMPIDFDNVLARIDSSGQAYYAIAIDDEDNSPFTFKNLVIGKTPYGDFKQPFIMTYTMSDEFAEKYLVTRSLENFQGKIKRSYLPPLSEWGAKGEFGVRDGGSDDTSDPDDVDPDDPTYPCEKEYTVGGGTGDTSTNTDNGSDPGTLTCEYFQVTETAHYANCINGDCSFYSQEIASYIEIECSITESSSSDADCPNDEGEIPILDEKEEWKREFASLMHLKTTHA